MVFALSAIINNSIVLLHIINTLFYLVILYISLWLILITVKGGFFDGLTYGFQKVGGSIFRRINKIEWEDKPLPSERINITLVPFFRFQAVTLACVMLLLLIFYYV
ncbi:DUF3899 domain-containing protein [Paraliobacillus sp. PM-2]|uniref:DUF3899 domain-containing protein n=1 Tax=Paraliobacillus sp. PM-2 TaxID=1462524 RepID=UPI00350E4337